MKRKAIVPAMSAGAVRHPWWAVIADPAARFLVDAEDVAQLVHGPFFSRQDADGYLQANRWTLGLGMHAKVVVLDGSISEEWRGVGLQAADSRRRRSRVAQARPATRRS